MSYLQKIDWKSLTIQKEIGKGSFATVHLGRWQGSEVAVKQLNVSHFPSDLSGDFEREASIHAQCNFPRIVRLFGITQEPGHFALVMEYCPQGSLYDVLHDASIELPCDKRWEIAIDVGAGLAYLHGAKILHQDLKSLNVLLDPEMRGKITDFGQSKVKTHTSTSTAQAGKATGTVRWRAPETFKRGYKPTESADVYSYGMILWEIASRAIPFADEQNDAVIIGWIKDGNLEDIPVDCPPDFTRVIEGTRQEAGLRPTVSQLHALLESTRPGFSLAPLSLATPKSWHFDTEHWSSSVNAQGYELFEAGAKDMEKVVQSYFQHPVPGYDIGRVEVIHNPDLNKKFAAQLNLLERRHGKAAFAPRWQMEGSAAERAHRGQMDALHQGVSAAHADPDAPHVRLTPLWHATRPEIVPGLLETGFAALATTDAGFFGKGIYSTAEAEYAYRVYGTSNYTKTGALLMNWVASYSAYPVIHGDMPKLAAKGAYANYDAHFIPVAPKNPSNPKEVNYFPCTPGQVHTYREMVVFDAASCLPRYLVHLQPSLPKQPGAIFPGTKPMVMAPTPSPKSKPTVVQGEAEYLQGDALFFRARYQEALVVFHQAASAGYPAAFLRLDYLYRNDGLIGPKNIPQADSWRAKAASCSAWFLAQAATGRPDAQFNAGRCYHLGIGVAKDDAQAVAWYRKAAEQGYAAAQRNLGGMYANGQGVAKDDTQAVAWFRKAAEQGYAHAQYALGLMYDKGQGVAKDDSQAIAWYRKAAEQGYANAQFNLGNMYGDGQGVAKDEAQAVAWYRKAAEQGYANAQFNLGNMYRDGRGVPKDDAQAVAWYRKAAEQGYAHAQFNLGWMYQNGQGVAKDDSQAIVWYRKAAEQGHAKAQFNLGNMYGDGQGVAKDDTQAVAWYRKAAEQGYVNAQSNLGNMYRDDRGVAKDDTQAVAWYRKAAEQGYAHAQSNLGWMYQNGQGVAKDDTQAVAWYRKAAEQGYAHAQCALGVMYQNGQGVAKDDVQAFAWYCKAADKGYTGALDWLQKAADQGNMQAQLHLGDIYEMGQGVAKNEAKAVDCYQKAAHQGHIEAQYKLAVRYAEGQGICQNDEIAVSWYRKAAGQGHAAAQNNLGIMYADGRWLYKNHEKAVLWYRKAAEQGYPDAQYNLGYMYANGRGARKDNQEAAVWYLLAAEQAHAKAQAALGECYEKGLSITKDDTQALIWYQKAADQGNPAAQYALGWKYENGFGVVQDTAQAMNWYQKAAKQGDANAQGILGWKYENGLGVAQDTAQAMIWYQKAAAQGDKDAQANLRWLQVKEREGVVKNEAALAWIRQAAEQGNAIAQVKLAEKYEIGEEVSQDYNHALFWYRKAAEQGHVIAQHQLETVQKKLEQGAMEVPFMPSVAYLESQLISFSDAPPTTTIQPQTYEARCATPPLQKSLVPHIQRNSPPAFLIALKDDDVPASTTFP